ncbi:MAG: hypothetical protein JSS22_15880 [Proteobacteria bacterium]|nr:hypothetical protein [Pseudomonadota bacterium]
MRAREGFLLHQYCLSEPFERPLASANADTAMQIGPAIPAGLLVRSQ